MKILIVNLHSSKNLGDEAILRATIYLLSNRYQDLDITLMANDPESWSHFNSCKVIPSFIRLSINNFNDFAFNYYYLFLLFLNLIVGVLPFFKKINNKYTEPIQKIKKADLIFSCGGGNFYSNSFIGLPLLLNCLIILYSGLWKKRIIFLPQSFGPLKKKFHQLYIKMALHFSERIFVRENKSFEFIKSLGINDPKVEFMPDLAIYLTKVTQIYNDSPSLKEFGKIKIGFSLMDRSQQDKNFSNQESYESSIVLFVEELLNGINAEVHFFIQSYGPTNDQNDNFVSLRIFDKIMVNPKNVYIRNDFHDSLRYLNELKEMDIIIATRMHTAILGLISYIPVITIGYQHKSLGLMELLNLQEYFIEINHLDNMKINACYEQIIKNRKQIIETIENNVLTLQNRIFEKIMSLN